MAETRVRLGGSDFTAFIFDGKPILFLDTVTVNLPEMVGEAVPIQPIGEKHPIEIATLDAVSAGTIQCTVLEWWYEEYWQRLADYLSDKRTTEDVLNEMLIHDAISLMEVITSPTGGQRVRVFHGCKITKVSGVETINVKTMQIPKQFTIMYTHFSNQ